MDLTKYKRITAEQYYTEEWIFTDAEINLAEQLDEMPHINRTRSGSEKWNLWACVYRDRYLEYYDEDEDYGLPEKNIFDTGKQLINSRLEINEHLIIDLRLSNSTGKIDINLPYLNCENLLFPFAVVLDSADIANHISNFRKSVFCDSASFQSTKFKQGVNFIEATFYGEVYFNDAILEYNSFFTQATFNQSTHFINTKFSNEMYYSRAIFNNTYFAKVVNFTAAHFNNHVKFTHTIFNKNVDFSKAIFKGEFSTSRSLFIQQAKFSGTVFHASSKICHCIFRNNFDFIDVTVNRAFELSYNNFLNKSDFIGTHFFGAIILESSKFGSAKDYSTLPRKTPENIKCEINNYETDSSRDTVPNFTSTIFTIPPNLSFTEIPVYKEIKGLKCPFSVPQEITHKNTASKFRRLAELARLGNNHHAELQFFRSEMLAKRKHEVEDKQNKWINAYERVSKFGTSLTNPILLLIINTLIFFIIYYFIYNCLWLEKSWDADASDIFIYSIHNLLPFIGATSEQKLHIIETIFGGYDTRPSFFSLLTSIQIIINIILQFLLLLAARNYFRLR